MISLVASLALSTAMTVAASTSVEPVQHDGPLARAAAAAFSRSQADKSAAHLASSNDPLKNGAIIGTLVGGVSVALGAGSACALDDLLGAQGSSCTGAMIVGGAIGASLGALIGVGIDAMFDRAPGTGVSAVGRRKGVRLRFGF